MTGLKATIYFLLITGSLRAQAPIQTIACELARAPESYAGKLVTFRASIHIDFEDFEVPAAKCEERLIDGIWLEYGRGPKRQPTIWCCGDVSPRGPVVLRQDAEFRKFHKLLTAKTRNDIIATLTGKFDAVKTEPCRDGIHKCCPQGGFGHFGFSCARLVIQSVADAVDPSVHRTVEPLTVCELLAHLDEHRGKSVAVVGRMECYWSLIDHTCFLAEDSCKTPVTTEGDVWPNQIFVWSDSDEPADTPRIARAAVLRKLALVRKSFSQVADSKNEWAMVYGRVVTSSKLTKGECGDEQGCDGFDGAPAAYGQFDGQL